MDDRPFLTWEARDGIVTLTMNRPEARNAIGEEGDYAAFEDAVARINGDETLRAVILTGAGTAFCAGGNVKDMANRANMFAGGAPAIRRRYRDAIHRIPLALDRLEVPIIAAVNGAAMGAGCDLACMCDLRIASERAVFGAMFVKLGLVPGDGGAWFLTRAIGTAKAAEMILTGDSYDADTALAMGLVSKCVPHDGLMEEARVLAQRIARHPHHALRMAKQLLKESVGGSLRSVLEMSAAFQAIAHETDEHRAAVSKLDTPRP